MSEQSSNIVSKVWGLCNPLRDDGVSYGDYLEQLTYLIFLKMSDEYSRPPYKRETGIPKGYTWSDMNTLKGAELENQYRAILERLGDEGGILGQIFKGAVNKISNVSILYRVVQMIDKENWVSMSSDVKGEIYEGLLQKNAEDVKSGAGQYFTPRPLIKAMVACLRPEPKKTIADPCCGSGGFFLAAQAFLADPKNYALDRTEKEFLKNETFYGTELVVATFKLCLMNLYLHNIGDLYGKVPVMRGDALLSDPGYRVDYVLTNPPFGKKSSITFTNEEEEQEEEDLVYNRQDFWTTSSNKQLNFIQQMLFLVNHSQDSPMRQIGYGFLFLDQLVQSSASHQAQSPRRLRDFYMKEALSFIEQHYSEDISIEDISSFCGLNRSYFSKVFRDTMGESPQGFLLHYRMARAAQLLTESRLPIRTISTMVSYPNQLHFSRAFKNVYGISPRDYRAKHFAL